MNVVLVYNPTSGSSLKAEALQHKFQENNITIDEMFPLDGAIRKNLRAYTKKPTIIAVVGGDGTLSAIAEIVVGTKATLAPLPGGTLNHFTKDLGISQNIDEAIKNLLKSKRRRVDVATVNGKVFLNNSSVGLYPSSLRDRNRFEDHLGKWPAAIIASIRSFARFRAYEVTIDDETFRTPFVFVGNNDYKINKAGGPERRQLTEGCLSVFIAKTSSRRVLLKIAFLALIGKAKSLEEFEIRKTTSFVIKAKKKYITVSRDGEVDDLVLPLRFETRKASLSVL